MVAVRPPRECWRCAKRAFDFVLWRVISSRNGAPLLLGPSVTWSYNISSTDDKDKVRFYCGDTDTNDQLVSDEEIDFVLDVEPTLKEAAATVCDHLAAKYAREVDKDAGELSLDASKKSAAYAALAATLRADGARTSMPYAGGISKSRVESVNDDTDRVTPAFFIGMHDRLAATNPTPSNVWST